MGKWSQDSNPCTLMQDTSFPSNSLSMAPNTHTSLMVLRSLHGKVLCAFLWQNNIPLHKHTTFCPFIICWVFDWFPCFTVMSNSSKSTHVLFCVNRLFISFVQVPRRGTVGLQSNSVFHVFRNCQFSQQQSRFTVPVAISEDFNFCTLLPVLF